MSVKTYARCRAFASCSTVPLVFAACLSGVAVPGVALAQNSSAPTSAQSAPVPSDGPARNSQAPVGQNDIVVTALRRNEGLQEAPAAISVVTASTIQSAGINDTADISKVVAPLRFETGVRPGVPMVSLRGIGSVQGGDAPISIVVDGVQVPFLSMAAMDLLDATSVELLRGPQGALYGRGAIAGALVVNTRRPSDEFGGSLKLKAEKGDDYRATGVITGPVIPGVLNIKLVGSYQTRNGLIYNVTRREPVDYVDQGTLKGELLFTPSERTTISLRAGMSRGTVGTYALSRVPVGGSASDFETYRVEGNYDNSDKRRLWSTSLKIDQEIPIGTITSITQYSYAKDTLDGDFDYSASPQRHNLNYILDKGWNQDLRLSSFDEGAFTWFVGGSYQYREGYNYVNVLPDPAATTPQASLFSYQEFDSKSWSVYGQGTYKFGAGFSFTGALRYDEDKRYDELIQSPTSPISGTFKALQPSATLKWQASPTFMAYATYGKGFRSGGFNAANLVTPQIGAKRIYPKEISQSYELGFKAQLLDRKLTANVAAYRTEYRDTQFQRSIVAPVVAKFITSVAEARVNGVEADLIFNATPDLTLTASYALTDSKITDFDGTNLYVGNRLPNVYHDNQHLSAEYRPPLTDTIDGLLRIDWSRRGRISYDLTGDYTYKPVSFTDARLGITTDRYSFSLFASNIFDKRAPETFVPLAFGPLGAARLENQPFRWGAEFSVEF